MVYSQLLIVVLFSLSLKSHASSAFSICEGLLFNSSRMSCLNIVRNGYFSDVGVRVCESHVFESDKLNCLQEIKDKYFSPAAAQICGNLVFSSDKNSCLRTISNKDYYPQEINICSRNIFASDTIACLRQMGQTSYLPTPPPPVNPRPGRPIQPGVGGDYCFVKETNEWLSGDEFFSLVHEFAKRERTCATARITHKERSGRIYDRDGRRVARERGGLSNREIDEVIRQYRLGQCRRFTCTEYN